MVAAGLRAGFPTDRDGINLGHPGLETHTVHRYVENHTLTAQNREISFLPALRKKEKKKGQSGHLRPELL